MPYASFFGEQLSPPFPEFINVLLVNSAEVSFFSRRNRRIRLYKIEHSFSLLEWRTLRSQYHPALIPSAGKGDFLIFLCYNKNERGKSWMEIN